MSEKTKDAMKKAAKMAKKILEKHKDEVIFGMMALNDEELLATFRKALIEKIVTDRNKMEEALDYAFK